VSIKNEIAVSPRRAQLTILPVLGITPRRAGGFVTFFYQYTAALCAGARPCNGGARAAALQAGLFST